MAQHDPLSLKVHHKNPKSGKIERVTPYRVVFEGRVRKFEVPTGSGKFFFENGEAVPAAECPKVTPVQVQMSESELRAKHNAELQATSAENEALKAKLAAFENQKKAEISVDKYAAVKPAQK